jgi:hypothetical protein
LGNISTEVVINQLLGVLREAFEGPPPDWCYFTDAGLFGTLAKLSPEEVSSPCGGSTVAAHVNHVLFSLRASQAWIQGDKSPRNWQESWSVSTADDVEWLDMLDQLRSAYQSLYQTMQTHSSSSLRSISAATGVIAHVAYHLGVIRHMVACKNIPSGCS